MRKYTQYDRCQSAKGHDQGLHGDKNHGRGNVLFLASSPQAFRVDQSERPNPERGAL